MNPSMLFQFANSYVVIGWFLLLVVPNWKYTMTIVKTGIIFLFAILYTYLISKGITNFNPQSFSSIEKVRVLFQDDNALTAGWIHYLAFDLFVGATIVEHAKQAGISRWIVSVALPFTFMFGPIGYLIYKTVKLVKIGLK